MNSYPRPESINTILDMIKSGKLDLSPEFQRNYVWDNKRASLLIDSLMRDIRLDPIILHLKDSKYALVDGKQRVTSIKRFIDNEFSLIFSGKEQVVPELSGIKKFKDLSSDQQNKLGNKVLDIVIIDESDEDEIRIFFKRKNVGGLKLTNQEIRSGVSGGSFKRVLQTLQSQKKFKDLWGNKYEEDSRKQKTDENVLKFAGFYDIFIYGHGMDDYPMMAKFLDKKIEEFAELTKNGDKKIREIEDKFNFSVKKCHDIFYSDLELGIKLKPFKLVGGKQNSWPVCLAQLLGFALLYTEADNDGLRKNSDVIRNAMEEYLTDVDVQNLVNERSNDKPRIRQFFHGWFDTLYSILQPVKRDRFIEDKIELKANQFKLNKICPICKNQITSIKHVDLDHIKPSSKGGSNSKRNLQITHYSCNRAAGNKENETIDDDE